MQRAEHALRAVATLYEDEDLLALSKPPGVLSHPLRGQPYQDGLTMQDLAVSCGATSVLHRLDRDTTGVLLCAKAAEAYRAVQDSWGDTRKEYLALVCGAPEQRRWVVDIPLKKPAMGLDKARKRRRDKRLREEALVDTVGSSDTTVDSDSSTSSRAERRIGDPWAPKAAATEFELVGEPFARGHASLLRCRLLEGGRTHQIRRHLERCGQPVVGDPLYGSSKHNRFVKKRNGSVRTFLHAWRLRLLHPSTGRTLELEDPLPDDMADAVSSIEAGGLSLLREALAAL